MYLRRYLLTIATLAVHTISFCPDAIQTPGLWGSTLAYMACPDGMGNASSAVGALMIFNNRILPTPLVTAGKSADYIGALAESVGLDADKTKKSVAINQEALGAIQFAAPYCNVAKALHVPQDMNRSVFHSESRAFQNAALFVGAYSVIFGCGHAAYLILSTERGENLIRKLIEINSSPTADEKKEENKQEPSGVAAQLIASSGQQERNELTAQSKQPSEEQKSAASDLAKKSNPQITSEQIERYRMSCIYIIQATTAYGLCQWVLPKIVEKINQVPVAKN